MKDKKLKNFYSLCKNFIKKCKIKARIIKPIQIPNNLFFSLKNFIIKRKKKYKLFKT